MNIYAKIRFVFAVSFGITGSAAVVFFANAAPTPAMGTLGAIMVGFGYLLACDFTSLYARAFGTPGQDEPVQYVLVRKDLKMRRGKECAQTAHASMAAYKQAQQGSLSDQINAAAWDAGSFTKIVLQVDSELALLDACATAKAAGVPYALIRDNGTTEFGGVPTHTTLGIGPLPRASATFLSVYKLY